MLNIKLPVITGSKIKPSGDSNNMLKAEFFENQHSGIPYPQVFQYKYGYVAGLSVLDLLFNEGPEVQYYLQIKS